MRSALFSTRRLLSGTPPDAPGPQAGRSAASAPPGFPPARAAPARPCTRSPCATRVLLGVGPETRSLPAAGSSEPHFLPAGRGEAESISCCALTAAETSSQSAPSGGRPGAKVQLRAGRAGARRRERVPRLPPHPRVWGRVGSTLPDEANRCPALHSSSLLWGSSTPERGMHLQRPPPTPAPQEPLCWLSPEDSFPDRTLSPLGIFFFKSPKVEAT